MSTAQFAGMNAEQAVRFMAGHGDREQLVDHRLAELVGPNARVLDIGCGKALHVSKLYTPEQYHGVDCSAELLAIAQRANPGYRFLHDDVSRWVELTLRRGAYDVAVIKSVLEHLPEGEARAVYEVARFITPRVLVAWHTPPRGVKGRFTTYEGELGIMQQNRHRRDIFGGVVVRSEVCGPHTIWEVA